MSSPNHVQNRYRGSLLGLAVGDAVGTTLEFMPRGTFPRLTDMVGGGPFNLKPGQWTDDTSLALCLAESLVEQQGFVPVDQLQRYLMWWKNGYWSSTGKCFDIGNTTIAGLSHFSKTGEVVAPTSEPRMAGNGSIMRLAPVPMAFRLAGSQMHTRAEESSLTTHAAPVAVEAASYFSGLIAGALSGVDKDTLLDDFYSPAEGYFSPYRNPLETDIWEVAKGSFKEKSESEIRGSGYALHTLEAALWAFYHTDNYEEGLLKVVNLGEDTDTTGAVYGQLAGAFYGMDQIPQRWLNKVYMREEIISLADGLERLSHNFEAEKRPY